MAHVEVAKSAGFCFGVSRAVKLAESAAENGGKIATLGPIIHNDCVVERLAQKGVRIINSPDEALPDETVVIRSHGIDEKTERRIIENGNRYIDATCPFVKKIHRLVNSAYQENKKIIIIGDPNHPEVRGINGWCGGSALVVQSCEEAENITINGEKSAIVVSQTTFDRELWKKIAKIIKNTCQSTIIFDTICSATNERQEEARSLAEKSDCFIVIGDRKSSNTMKLFNLAKPLCANVYFAENAASLPRISVGDGELIGITAGASTPDWIIKEVLKTMVEEKNTNIQGNGEPTFAEAFEQSLVTLYTGQVVKGTVISVTPTEVYVDLGYKADGIISADELTEDPTVTPDKIVNVGDEVEVFVVRVNDAEGYVRLSKKRIDAIKGMQAIEKAYETGETLTGRVIENVNRGVIATTNGCRVFIPASMASERFMQDLSPLVGQEVKFRIVNIRDDRRGKKIIGSIKVVAVEEHEKKIAEFMENVEIGKVYTGTVKTLTNFGAFVDLGGVDGLIHISQLSWQRIKHPSEVVKEGDVVQVYVLDVNKETNKVSLGYKKAEDNPWEIAKAKFHEGDVVNVKVVRLVPFGAFVELIPGIDGLVHISQISDKRIGKPADVLAVGENVDAKITEINWETKKIGLSIRAVIEDALKVAEQTIADAPEDVTVTTEE